MGKKTYTFKLNYYDDVGKRRGKTFTAPTMREARLKAAQWELDHRQEEAPALSVVSAVERYIQLKKEVLSPSTYASYKNMMDTHIKGHSIAGKDANKLEDSDVQLWISDLAADGLGTKTIRNCFSLLQASVKMFTRRTFVVTLGQAKKPDLYCPSNDDIKVLLGWIREHKRDSLERAVYLAAFGPLRRGEICALTKADIKGNMITVNKAVVRNEFNTWELKQPKTQSSYRTIEMPEFVIQAFDSVEDPLIRYTPHSLGEAFREAVRESGVHHFRFHDLRHYAASILNYNGISDRTIMQRGGWATTHVMKRVYQNEIDEETRRETQKTVQFFSENFGEISNSEAKSEAKH